MAKKKIIKAAQKLGLKENLLGLLIVAIIISFTMIGVCHLYKILQFFLEKSILPLNDLSSAYYYTLSAIIQSNSALLGLILLAQTFGSSIIKEKKIDKSKSDVVTYLRWGGWFKSLERSLKTIYLSYISLLITIFVALSLMRYPPNVSTLYSIIWVEIGALILSMSIILELISITQGIYQEKSK